MLTLLTAKTFFSNSLNHTRDQSVIVRTATVAAFRFPVFGHPIRNLYVCKIIALNKRSLSAVRWRTTQPMDQNYYFTSIFQYPVPCESLLALCKCLLNKALQSIKHLWKWHLFLTPFPLTFCTYYVSRRLMMFLPRTLRDSDKHWHDRAETREPRLSVSLSAMCFPWLETIWPKSWSHSRGDIVRFHYHQSRRLSKAFTFR